LFDLGLWSLGFQHQSASSRPSRPPSTLPCCGQILSRRTLDRNPWARPSAVFARYLFNVKVSLRHNTYSPGAIPRMHPSGSRSSILNVVPLRSKAGEVPQLACRPKPHECNDGPPDKSCFQLESPPMFFGRPAYLDPARGGLGDRFLRVRSEHKRRRLEYDQGAELVPAPNSQTTRPDRKQRIEQLTQAD